MRAFTLPLLLTASLGLTSPALAETDFKDVIGGIAQSLIQQELDRSAYIAAQEANTVAAYRDYLAKFPKGMFRSNAEKALARLGAPVAGSVEAAAEAEAKLGITSEQRVAVQRELTRLGFSTYGTDGVWGRKTRTAIGNWQTSIGKPATGYLTKAQLGQLLKGAVVETPPKDDDQTSDIVKAAQGEAKLGLTRSQRIEIQRQLTKLGYNAGVADGLWGSRTRAAILAWQKANKRPQTGYITGPQVRLLAEQTGQTTPPPDDVPSADLEESLLGLTTAERVDLQRRLTRLGYPTYGSDGVFGANTRRAIAAWQRDEGATVTGYLTADQVRRIRVDTGG